MTVNLSESCPKKDSFVIKNLGLLLFFSMLIVSLFSYKDYGISWDEPKQRHTGNINYKYIFHEDQELMDYTDRDYGAAFELALIFIEKLLDISDSRDIYLMRHLVSHSFFLLACFCYFLLIDFLYNNKLLAALGFFLVVLHPLLYAHSFFNSKDVPFMSMWLICLYFIAISFHQKSLKKFMLLGVLIGLLINLRIVGIMILCIVLLFLFLDAFKENKIFLNLKYILTLLIFSFGSLFITWPFLWSDPLGNFATAFNNMSHFRWIGEMLFDGRMILSTDLPWFYIPAWSSITTPIPYLLLGISGSTLLIIHLFRKPLQVLNNTKKRNNLIYLICCYGPLAAVIILESVLYDSWRQMFFIYAGFALLSVYGLHYLLKKKLGQIVIVAFPVTFGAIIFFMIKNHPYQHIYFNLFVNDHAEENLRKNYELDFWGTSYKEAYEYLLQNDSSDIIKVYFKSKPGLNNIKILSRSQRERIEIASLDEADYFITNYRWHPQDFMKHNEQSFHKIQVDNNTIVEIFKLE